MESPPVTDVVARLHGLYQKKPHGHNDQLPVLRETTVPQTVLDTLATLHLDFDALPRALQHALLWEAGYATTADGQVLEFYVSCGFSSTDALALSSLSVPTCAVISPQNSELASVWFVFADSSPLPLLPTTVDDNSAIASESSLVPCSRARHASFCRPHPLTSVNKWLSVYAAEKRDGTVDHQSMPGDDVSATIPSYPLLVDRRLDTVNIAPSTGLSSDFTTALYSLRAAGATLPRLEIRSGVPSDVLARLDAFHMPFKSLTGLLQRAVLWDTGYAVIKFSDDSSAMVDIVPVFVKCGLRMANIAPDPAYFEWTGCAVQDCSVYNSSSDGSTYSLRARDCPVIADDGKALTAVGSKLVAMSRCAVLSSVDSLQIPVAATATVWALGNISTDEKSPVPRLRLQKHPLSTETIKLYAIHSVPTEVSIGSCPAQPSFVIPCATVDQTSLHQEWCRPVQSELISTWLRQEQHQEMALATLILMAGAILIALALDLFADRKPRLFRNARVSANSMPSLTSSLFDGPNEEPQEQEISQGATSDQTGLSSVRSAESVRSVD